MEQTSLYLPLSKVEKNTYGHSVEILGPSKVIYGGNDKPLLPCGARVVIETEAETIIEKEDKITIFETPI